MKGRIDLGLFADILCEEKRYSIYDEKDRRMKASADIPLIRAYNDIEGRKRILLLGNASQGKSTALRTFAAEQLYFNRRCLLYPCGNFRTADELYDIAETEASEGDGDSVLIFDAYDELDVRLRGEFCDMLKQIDKSEINIILSSRYNPLVEEVRDGGMIAGEFEDFFEDRAELHDVWDDDDLYGDRAPRDMSFFRNYKQMQMLPFRYEQLDAIVDKSVNRNGEYFKLLEATMFLVMHMILEEKQMIGELESKISTEAAFIDRYFSLVARKKSGRTQENGYIRLGEYVYAQRRGKYPRKAEAIPEYLNDILFYRTVHVKSAQGKTLARNHLDAINLKYLNFFEANYIKDKVVGCFEEADLRAELNSILKNLPATDEAKEVLYYVGQLMIEQAVEGEMFEFLNEIPSDILSCEMKRAFALGYCNGEAKDIEGVFSFFGRDSASDPMADAFIRGHIRSLSASSFGKDQIPYCKEGLPVLEEIRVENKDFKSEGNCLIRRSDNGLWLGCNYSVIPDYVLNIRQHAFSYCSFLQGIDIPDSVKVIDSLAFMRCEALEWARLGRNVTSLKQAAFYHCTSLRSVVFGNKNMEIGVEYYNRKAFEYSGGIEELRVPTTAIRYAAAITQNKLKKLSVYQGVDKYGAFVPLSFNDVPQFFELRELHISADLEEITEEAFFKRRNVLEKIEVDEGHEEYRSVNNCLIKKNKKLLVLGCKNSIIPDDGSVTAIGAYAFATVEDFRHLDLNENIVQIGEYAFAGCSDLESVRASRNLKYIDLFAFSQCSSLKKVQIEDAHSWSQVFFAHISSNPICYAKRVELLSSPDNSIKIEDGAEKISAGAFRYAQGVESVIIPPSVCEIGGTAFLECTSLSGVYIEDLRAFCGINFKSYSANPLSNSARLYLKGEQVRELTFGKDIERISKGCFVKCKELQSVCFEGDARIGELAFDGCGDLKKVIFNSPDIRIEGNSFGNCSVDVYYRGRADQWETITAGRIIEGINNVFFEE